MLQTYNHPYHSQQQASTVSNPIYFFKGDSKKTDEPQKAEANKKEEPLPKQQGQ